MKICSKCKFVVNNGICPMCERTKFVTEAKEDDLVVVTSADYVTSPLVEDILKDAGIRFMKKGALGGAITLYVGELTETYNFYVFARDYERALELIPDFDTEEEFFEED